MEIIGSGVTSAGDEVADRVQGGFGDVFCGAGLDGMIGLVPSGNGMGGDVGDVAPVLDVTAGRFETVGFKPVDKVAGTPRKVPSKKERGGFPCPIPIAGTSPVPCLCETLVISGAGTEEVDNCAAFGVTTVDEQGIIDGTPVKSLSSILTQTVIGAAVVPATEGDIVSVITTASWAEKVAELDISRL